MKINLKKAHVISQRLLEAPRTVPTSVDISVFSKEFGAQAEGEDRFQEETVARIISARLKDALNTAQANVEMINAAQSIRQKVSEAQTRVGIDRLLAERRALELSLQSLKTSPANSAHSRIYGHSEPAEPAVTTSELVLKTIDRLKFVQAQMQRTNTPVTSGEVKVDLAPLIKQAHESAVRTLQRQLDDINEELVGLNHSTYVELAPEEITAATTVGALG